ncbi:hypothetical protein BH09ACT12_BH09ACT12_26760 [soil metagenome]
MVTSSVLARPALASPVRLLSLVVTLAASAGTVALLVSIDGDALQMMRYQRSIGELPYAAGIGWLVVAPLFFVIGSAYSAVARTPWVLLCLVHLVVLLAVSVEFRALMSRGYWIAAAVYVAAALSSAAVAAAGSKAGPGDF